jgi:hypothetical protein
MPPAHLDDQIRILEMKKSSVFTPADTPTTIDTRLRGRWLVVARIAWLALALLAVGVYVTGLVVQYDLAQQICTAPAEVCDQSAQLTPEGVQTLQQLGLSLRFNAVFATVRTLAWALVSWSVAALIFWRKSDDWMALLVALFLVVFVDPNPLHILRVAAPSTGTLAYVVEHLGITCAAVFYLFPDGRFVPRWARWLALLWVVVWNIDLESLPYWFSAPLWMGTALSLVIAQVIRYRRASDPVQLQQTKWVVFGVGAAFAGLVGLVLLSEVIVPSIMHLGSLSMFAFPAAFTLFMLLIPLSIGLAILRYRLYDIDVIINRTLVYGVLTIALALIYIGSVVLLQQLLNRFIAGSELAIVASTLAIAALFSPLRRRIQAFIDKRFYRRKYNAAQVLAAFSAKLRDETDLDTLASDLLQVVDETVQPAHVSLWLRPTIGDKPRAGEGKHA